MDGDTNEAIRIRAYHLWQKEGCPDGRDLEFWERARLIEEAEAAAGARPAAEPRSEAERTLDEASAASFPASDPPSFTPPSGAGSAAERKSDAGRSPAGRRTR
ncbi:MAG: hypothetical protein NVSMB18_33770 [Acetobacteraceae bacterium]